MGLRPSPFICTQSFGWSEEGIRGDPRAKDNPLRWDELILNLPGSDDYDPKMLWAYKYDTVIKRMAAFLEPALMTSAPGLLMKGIAGKRHKA